MHMSINATTIVLFLVAFFQISLSLSVFQLLYASWLHGIMAQRNKQQQQRENKINATQNELVVYVLASNFTRNIFEVFKPIELWHFTNLLMNQRHNIPHSIILEFILTILKNEKK